MNRLLIQAPPKKHLRLLESEKFQRLLLHHSPKGSNYSSLPKADPRHPENLAYLAQKAVKGEAAFDNMSQAYKDAVEESRRMRRGSEVDEMESKKGNSTSEDSDSCADGVDAGEAASIVAAIKSSAYRPHRDRKGRFCRKPRRPSAVLVKSSAHRPRRGRKGQFATHPHSFPYLIQQLNRHLERQRDANPDSAGSPTENGSACHQKDWNRSIEVDGHLDIVTEEQEARRSGLEVLLRCAA